MPEQTPSIDLSIDDIDRRIIEATQANLPLQPRPYHAVAEQLGLAASEVMTRMQRLLEQGVIRRIGAIPNHYALGYAANGMSVWDVPDEKIAQLGARIGALDFVSHCYHRPRQLPDWPYNLFAMVHGRDRESTQLKVQQIAEMLGEDDHGHEVLYSSRILKKTGLRLGVTSHTTRDSELVARDSSSDHTNSEPRATSHEHR